LDAAVSCSAYFLLRIYAMSFLGGTNNLKINWTGGIKMFYDYAKIFVKGGDGGNV
jgi:hypothetical protein